MSGILTGQRLPDLTVVTPDGETLQVPDVRPPSHLVLLHEPEATPELLTLWQTAIRADRRQWAWLNVRVVLVQKVSVSLAPGAYAVDRSGTLLAVFPSRRWTFDDLEREFINYEVRHG